MPNREVIDLSYGSGNPQGTGVPFIPGPRKEPYTEDVLDTTVAGPAAIGKILVEDFSQFGSASWKLAAAANQAVPSFACGAVLKPAGVNAGVNTFPANAGQTPNQTQATVVVSGPAMAYVQSQSNANKAINIGDPLCLDAAGNLTSAPAAPVSADTIVAYACQAVAGGTAAALCKVRMGK